jgi:hypothetical protein
MGHFAQLNDDDAELLSGGTTNPSTAYGGSNYGQYLKSGGSDLPNPGGNFARKK